MTILKRPPGEVLTVFFGLLSIFLCVVLYSIMDDRNKDWEAMSNERKIMAREMERLNIRIEVYSNAFEHFKVENREVSDQNWQLKHLVLDEAQQRVKEKEAERAKLQQAVDAFNAMHK